MRPRPNGTSPRDAAKLLPAVLPPCRHWCLSLSLLSCAVSLGAQPSETVVVAPGARLIPRTGPDLVVEAAWGDETPAPLEELVAPPSGDHRLTLRSRDRAGVASEERRILIRVDGDGPRLELRFDPAASADGRWARAGAVVELHTEDENGTIAESSLALVASDAPRGTRVSLPNAGTVELAASAVDAVGNRTDRRFEVRVDAAPPTAALEVDGPSAVSRRGWELYGPELTLRVVASDEESGVERTELTIDGETSVGAEWTGRLAHGWHTIAAEVTDRVGHRASASRRIEVDAQGPEIRWEPVDTEALRKGRRASGRLAAIATDPDAGGARLEWALDPAGPWRLYEIGEGPTESPVHFRAEDVLGNRSELEVDWKAADDPSRPPADEEPQP